MKFAQLSIGLRFRYQDREYRKTSPLMAEPEGEGAARLIPRSADVFPLDAVPEPAEAPTEIALGELNRAMARLADEINDIIADSGLDAQQASHLARQLQQAFERARQTLRLPPNAG
jgi:hypothetical protein